MCGAVLKDMLCNADIIVYCCNNVDVDPGRNLPRFLADFFFLCLKCSIVNV